MNYSIMTDGEGSVRGKRYCIGIWNLISTGLYSAGIKVINMNGICLIVLKLEHTKYEFVFGMLQSPLVYLGYSCPPT